MKTKFISAICFLVTTSASSAFESHSAIADKVSLIQSSRWAGFYVGLNAGYGFGANGNVNAQSISPSQNSMTQITSPQTLLDGYTLEVPTSYSNNSSLAALGFLQALSTYINMGGFVGGGQAGYNFITNANVMLGVETDIQGTTLNGSTTSQREGEINTTSTAVGMWSVSGTPYDTYNASITNHGSLAVSQKIQSGLNWIGTVRARVGYLVAPDMLVYATGGLAYGNVFANTSSQGAISNNFNGNITRYINGTDIDGVYPSSGSNGIQAVWGNQNRSKTLAGWTLGGGLEKDLDNTWSLKTEALFYSLGSLKTYNQTYISGVSGSAATGLPTISPSAGIVYGSTSLNYNGILLRVGINRHFSLGSDVIASR